MDQETLALDEAFKILELTGLDNVDEPALQKIRRHARRRWHPDTIAYLKPDRQTIAEYERNFRLIDRAADLVSALLRGEADIGSATAGTYRETVSDEPEEVIRRNAADMQTELRKVWERVKATGYRMVEEAVTVHEGVPYKDLLMDDLKENVPVLAVSALVNGVVLLAVGMIAALPLGFLGDVALQIGMWIVALLWVFQALACVIAFLPLSRFWLPDFVSEWVYRFVNAGLYVNRYVAERNLDQNLLVALLIGLPIRIAQAFKWVVLFPLYKLVGNYLGDRRMGEIKRRARYYAGLAEWYVEDLLRMQPSAMDREQLFHLSHLYSEIKDA